jgi:hypothetical protein
MCGSAVLCGIMPDKSVAPYVSYDFRTRRHSCKIDQRVELGSGTAIAFGAVEPFLSLTLRRNPVARELR